MKAHTNSFKEQIKLIGKEIDSRITFGNTVLGKDDLNAVTPSYQGAILKSVMKQLDIDSNVEIPIGTILKYEFGLKVNGEYEYINYGNYVVYSVEKQEDTNSYKIVCYDKLLYSMLDYVKLPITYPISIRDYINSISTALGLTFANNSGTFANYDKQIQADLYDGLGYTFRDVLDELAQVTASTICLNNNDELEIRYITETGDTIDEEFLKDVNVNFGEKFGAVNTIVLSRSGDSDSVYYPEVLPANPYEIKISDNQIMNGNDRADFLPDIYNKLNGLEFYTNDFVSTGICYYDLCDRYSVKVGDNTYSCVMFNDEVLVTQGLEENVYTELPKQTKTDYKHASKDDRMINQVYIIAKKNEAEILAVVNTTNQIQKEINPTKDESGSEIVIEDASNNPLTYLEVEGKSTQETRSGKNLWNLSSSFTNDTTTGKWVLSDTTVSIPAGTYTLSSVITGSDTFTLNYKYADNLDHNTLINSETTLTFTEEVKKIAIQLNANSSISNIQLEKGSTATEYEAYGISPSPDYPSEIESVGYENLWTNEEIGNINETTGENIYNEVRYRTKDYIMVSSNTSYTLSSQVSSSIYYIFYYYDENYNFISSKAILGLIATNVTPSNCKYMKCVIGDTTTIKTTNRQLEKGSIAHSYIPYGKYGIEVKAIGKNLANINDNTENVNNAWNFTVANIKANKTYTLYINVNGSVSINLKYYNNGNTEFIKVFDCQKGKNIVNFHSTKDDILYLNCFEKVSDGYSGMTEIMLIEGTYTIDTIGEYQPYQERISTIVLNEPLKSLPNGVKDIAYIRNNKLYVNRYVGSIILDGSESWNNFAIETTSLGRAILNDIGSLNTGDIGVMSDKLIGVKYNGSWNSEFDCVATYLNGFIIYLKDANDITSFKEKLSNFKPQIDYQLATPVKEELGEIEMLKTLKGHNNISITDKLLPIINLTYVRDTVIADYVENHVAELKITENEIKASVESVNSSVDGLNTTINRVEEITNDNSQVINVISTNIDRTSGEVREVTTTTGFTFNADGMTIDDGSGFKAQHRSNGTYYKDGDSIVGQYTKDGSKQKDLELFGTYSYGKESIEDTPMFVGQLYTDANGERGFGHFYNGEG